MTFSVCLKCCSLHSLTVCAQNTQTHTGFDNDALKWLLLWLLQIESKHKKLGEHHINMHQTMPHTLQIKTNQPNIHNVRRQLLFCSSLLLSRHFQRNYNKKTNSTTRLILLHLLLSSHTENPFYIEFRSLERSGLLSVWPDCNFVNKRTNS